MKPNSLLLAGLLMAVGPVASAAHRFDLATATIADIQKAIDHGALSSEKLVELYLARIEAYDGKGPKINSVITLNPKAIEEARALDRERLETGRRSPLHGIPVVIKDLIDMVGLPTTAGFTPFGSPIPERDAGVVARVKAAGGIILAKVATVNWFGNDGFSTTHPIGATLNPYNSLYQPGGSSNGTGAAIAAYFATVGIGTDTGGSVQNPAAYCSLVGMVASQGLSSRTGIVPRGPTHDRAGPMTRSVYDNAVLLAAMSGWDAEDLDTYQGIGHFPKFEWVSQLTRTNLVGLRIGVLREMVSTAPEDAPARVLFERAVEDLRKGGAQIVDPVLTGIDIRHQSSGAVSSVASYEMISSGDVYLSRLGPNRPYKTMAEFIAKVGPEKFSERYVNGLTLPAPDQTEDFHARFRARKAVRELIEGLIDRHDLDAFVLLYRSTPPLANAPSGPAAPVVPSLNNLTSTTGLPGIIMPGGYTSDNLPVGIQFVGKMFGDLKLLQVAHGYEQMSRRRKTPESTPPLPGESFEYNNLNITRR